MPIHPYIHFRGNCRDAIAAYGEILDGESEVWAYSETPDAPPAMAGSNLVMHATLRTPHGVIMASDFPPGMEGDPQQAVSITLLVDDAAKGKALHDALAEGGTVLQPYGPQFFSPGFGMCQDRFGTHWMIMTDAPAA